MATFDKNITLAILAGGKASRMGGVNKALIQIEGQPIIQRVYHKLANLFEETIIISNTHFSIGLPDTKIHPDIIRNTGPLGGIHSALINSRNNYIFVVSCDMPYVDSNIAKRLIEQTENGNYEIIIPKIGSFIEPLFAIYSKKTAVRIEKIIKPDVGKPITDLIKLSTTKYLVLNDTQENRTYFTNINTIEDLELTKNGYRNNRLH